MRKSAIELKLQRASSSQSRIPIGRSSVCMQPTAKTGNNQRNRITENAIGSERHAPADGGKLIVLTAPLTEAIDHAGYFIQMALASLPQWMEFVLDMKYPKWH